VPKNYRAIIDRLLDLADPTEPLELAQACENAGQVLRLAASQRDIAKEMRKAMEEVAPWFDPSHPINT
jgi:hypothetical protein